MSALWNATHERHTSVELSFSAIRRAFYVELLSIPESIIGCSLMSAFEFIWAPWTDCASRLAPANPPRISRRTSWNMILFVELFSAISKFDSPRIRSAFDSKFQTADKFQFSCLRPQGTIRMRDLARNGFDVQSSIHLPQRLQGNKSYQSSERLLFF